MPKHRPRPGRKKPVTLPDDPLMIDRGEAKPRPRKYRRYRPPRRLKPAAAALIRSAPPPPAVPVDGLARVNPAPHPLE